MSSFNSSYVKGLAMSVGFDKCGISHAEVKDSHISFFKNWLKLEYHAEMDYMVNNKDLRKYPSKLLKNAKSVISVILNYNTNENLKNQRYNVSKYALVNDYHAVMRSKLEELLTAIKNKTPKINARIFIDTAPVLERYFAMSSGLGFIGRNTCLINPDFGSWVFIGEIITDVEPDFYDSPIHFDCGECQLCVKACPCGALSKYGLNANKCISYHTIENKNNTPDMVAEKITNQVFGCDICQNVCPHNKIIDLPHSQLPSISAKLDKLNPEELNNLSNREFNRRFENTSLLRAGRKKIIENFSHLKNSSN